MEYYGKMDRMATHAALSGSCSRKTYKRICCCWTAHTFMQARFPELMEDFEGDVDRVAARVAWDYMQVNLGCQFLFRLHYRV
jgi:hypothetical protein